MPITKESIKLERLDFYSFFTKYSLMEEYGFSSGLASRLFRKILPIIPAEDTIEYFLLNNDASISAILSIVKDKDISDSPIAEQLNLSIKALCSKVAAFGLDKDIKAKYNFIGLDSKPFESLLQKVNILDKYKKDKVEDLISSVSTIESLIIELRKNKNKIGTNFHLTLTTRRILEYAHRIKELLNLKCNISSQEHWKSLLLEYIEYSKSKNSITIYVRRHSDLVALEIVEHTSNKGEKYIAENRKEYWSFFYKSLFGGGIISVFAFLKIIITSYQFTQLNNALFFSLNYALCFIIVKQLGGIIATKQPAMTASTIAKSIDAKDDLKIDSINSITILVRKVFRSQFVSIIGNFTMALTLACAIMYILQLLNMNDLIEMVRPKYLIKNVVPSIQLLAFAALAGFYLALSGLISGYIDNKVVASKIAYRIRASKLFLNSNRLASFVEKKAGALLGNLSLGFLLGSTFLLKNVLPFSVDIRHIAFSSANVGYSIMSYKFDIKIILLALAGALLIGLVNFLVSFSITLYLALQSRGANIKLINKMLINLLNDFLRNPLCYFIKINNNLATNKNENPKK